MYMYSINLVQINTVYVVLEIRRTEIGDFTVLVNNTCVSHVFLGLCCVCLDFSS